MCVQFWVPSQPDYVQSSLSYWNQASFQVWGSMRPWPRRRLTAQKKGNCINLIEGLLRRTKASALSKPAVFLRISTSYIAYSAVFLELIVRSPPKNVKRRVNPDTKDRPCLDSQSDLICLVLHFCRTEAQNEEESMTFTPTVNETGPFSGMELSISVC